MPPPNLGALRAVGERLDALGLEYAFVGGAIVNLLLDEPELLPARPTDDVDVIIETITARPYSELEAKLRELGFDHDMSEGAPLCRWVLGTLKVDIMPTEGSFLGLNTAWFKEALATVTECELNHTRLKLISPVAFLATKHVAFSDRGKRGGKPDYFASHDLEDFIAVVDGRKKIVDEIDRAPADLRAYVISSIRSLVVEDAFDEALPGHLPADLANQQRLPGLRAKLQAVAILKNNL